MSQRISPLALCRLVQFIHENPGLLLQYDAEMRQLISYPWYSPHTKRRLTTITDCTIMSSQATQRGAGACQRRWLYESPGISPFPAPWLFLSGSHWFQTEHRIRCLHCAKRGLWKTLYRCVFYKIMRLRWFVYSIYVLICINKGYQRAYTFARGS